MIFHKLACYLLQFKDCFDILIIITSKSTTVMSEHINNNNKANTWGFKPGNIICFVKENK